MYLFVTMYHFDQFAAGLEILKIYELRSGAKDEVTRDRRIE